MYNGFYFQIYKTIESEVLTLASNILFCDEQLDVYSINIANLIIRCGVEVESIIKDIYRIKGNDEQNKIGDIVLWMTNNWHLDKKKVVIISPLFQIESLKEFQPLCYKKESKEDYYSAYCAIKHDRYKNMKKANLYTLIRMLGALYIFNIIYKDSKIYLKNDEYGINLDLRMGSDIFMCKLTQNDSESTLLYSNSIDKSECLYTINERENGYSFAIDYIDVNDKVRRIDLIQGSIEFQQYAKSHIGLHIDEDDFWKNINIILHSNKEAFYSSNKIKSINDISARKMNSAYFAELNLS